MKVSLIMTVYNEGTSIIPFLESIFSGTKLPAEIVIADGGSSDSTTALIRNFFAHNDHVRLTFIESPERINIAKGRNLAIDACSYEIIAVTDAGCIVDQNWLDEITKPLQDSKVSVASGWYEPLPGTPFQNKIAAATVPALADINSEEFLPSSRSIAFRKACWRKIEGYPEWLMFAGEDTLFDIHLKQAGCYFMFAPKAKVFWDMRKDYKSLLKQYFLYGLGDGESGSLTNDYWKLIVVLLCPPLFLFSRKRFSNFWMRYLVYSTQTFGWIWGRLKKRKINDSISS